MYASKACNGRKCQLHASAAYPLGEIVPLAIYIGGYVQKTVGLVTLKNS